MSRITSARIVLASLSAVAVISNLGCATIVTGGGPEQKIEVRSTPLGAKVFVDNDYKGVTPCAVPVTRKDPHTVRAELEGYAPQNKLVESGINGWVFGNILLGGIIGIVVDAASGATNSPNPTKLDFTLFPPVTQGKYYPPVGR